MNTNSCAILIFWHTLVFYNALLTFERRFQTIFATDIQKTLIYRISLLVLFLFQCTYISALGIISSIKDNHSIHKELPSKKTSSQDLEFTEDGEEEESESHVLFPFDIRETLFFISENKSFFKDVKLQSSSTSNISRRGVPIFVWVQNFRI